VENINKIIFDDVGEFFSHIDWNELDGKSILVTGASGLLGTYFIATLKEICRQLDSPPLVIAVIHSPLAPFQENLFDFKQLNVWEGDLTSIEFCHSLPRVDYIIHAAGYGQPAKFTQDQLRTLKINTMTTLLLAEKLHPNGKFLFISTSEVYSGLSNPPFSETQIGTSNTLHARASYIEGKRTGETICNIYRNNGLNFKSARLALAYGPGTKNGDRRVLNELIKKAFEGKIELVDQGQAWRTYCYVSDAVETMWEILLHGTESIYNVGGKSRTTIAQLAEQISKLLEVSVKIPDIERGLTGAPDDVYLNLSKIETEFGKTKFVNLEEGLSRTIAWQKQFYQKPL